jgi:ubiquinone/menaquinone biosynthesis C-methylase UbiE
MIRHLGLFNLLLLVPFLAWGDEPEPKKKSDRYETRADHDQYGIGKFYQGREIAHVMGHQGAGWLERPEREKEEQPKKLLKALKLEPGMKIADIGAGSGFHVFRMAPVVGDKGKIFAVDIQPEMLAIIKAKMKKGKVGNVETILGVEADPKLPDGQIDLILMVDVYHEFAFPYEMTQKLIKALKPGGRLAFVEFKKEDPKVRILEVHKMSERQVMKEMDEFKEMQHVETIKDLPWQHVITFRKELQVLFIGNSQIFYNNLPKTLEALADSAPADRPRIQTDRFVPGGASLERLWEAGDGKGTVRAKIAEKKWDFVIVQEIYNAKPASFDKYAPLFHELIQKQGARTILFCTASVSTMYPKGFQDLLDMQLAMGKKLQVPVAAAGKAWLSFWGDKSTAEQRLDLYDKDKAHPGKKGSYIYACSLYAALTGKSPVGLTSLLPNQPAETISPMEAKQFQEAAWRMHQETNPEKAKP